VICRSPRRRAGG